MKKILSTLFIMMPAMLMAQARFGYLSYDSVLHQMPQYAEALQSVEQLRAKYDKETKRSEEEFQRKYTEFLQGQKEFPANIMVKRQAELQTLMDRSIAFREECQQILADSKRDLVHQVEQQLNEIITIVGVDNGYAYIINTDGNACPFINPALGDDVTRLVLVRLGLAEPEPVVNNLSAETPTTPETENTEPQKPETETVETVECEIPAATTITAEPINAE